MTIHAKERTALITGGSRGIGAAIAASLSAKGVKLILPSRKELDLSRADSVSEYLSKNASQKVDILINNAGINILNPIAQIKSEDWAQMLQVNLSSVLSLTQHYGPEMSRRNWGRILNISSIFGVVTKEKRAAYSMTKAALNSLTRTSAIEFGPGGVLVNSLAPGFVDTELTRQNNSEAQIEAITTTIPLRRMAQPSEIASVAQFLVSEENSYLSGQTIIVDGGLLAQ